MILISIIDSIIFVNFSYLVDNLLTKKNLPQNAGPYFQLMRTFVWRIN